MKLGKLFIGNGYAPQKKEWAWLPAVIGAAASIGSSLIGANASKSNAERAAKKEEQWYNKQYAKALRDENQSILDTKKGQNLLRMSKEHAREQWRKAAGAQAVSGGTASATQMAKDAGNKMVADTAANLAVMDDQRQERAKARMSNLDYQKMQMDVNRENAQANAVAQVAAGASNAIAQGASAFAADTSLKGGSNMSTPKTTTSATTSSGTPTNLTSQQQSNLDKINAIEANEYYQTHGYYPKGY